MADGGFESSMTSAGGREMAGIITIATAPGLDHSKHIDYPSRR
jgi:hypothetical protein